MPRYAKVRIPSALPQLDKEFDYLVPEEFGEIPFGTLVKVPFGKGTSKTAVVTSISNQSDFADTALPIIELLGIRPLITQTQLLLAVDMAERFCGSVGEILQDMLPKRMVRAEAKYLGSPISFSEHQSSQAVRTFIEPGYAANSHAWLTEMIAIARTCLERGQSALLIVPDFRDIAVLEQGLETAGLTSHTISLATSNDSEKYHNYLRALDEVSIVYGLRSAVLAPVRNLGAIAMLDESDETYHELSAPYWHARDVLLLRQTIDKCDLYFIGNAPSTEITRLVEIGYLQRVVRESAKPMVRITDNATRLDDETFGLISTSLNQGKSVLIQVANVGYATAIACIRCKEIRTCPQCETRIWIDTAGVSRCRSCKFRGQLPACKCGSQDVRPIRTGSTAVVQWLEKAFPNVNVVHSTADERILQLKAPSLVIATPGAEPEIAGGYAVVVLADALGMLGVPRLRALEKAVLLWSNAIAKCSLNGLCIFVGVNGNLADKLRKLELFDIVNEDYLDRKDLALPPVTRLCSVTASNAADLNAFKEKFLDRYGAVVRELSTSALNSFAFIYKYPDGKEIAEFLSNLAQAISTKSRNRKPGQRLFRICMDDWEVI